MGGKKVISVIGALSIDSIYSIGQMPERGACVRSKKHKELGGRGTNIAIAAYRSVHNKPDTADGLLPEDAEEETTDDEEDGIEVRLIGAVDNEDRREQFVTLLRRNGVKTDGVQVLEGLEESGHATWTQRAYSEEISINDEETGRARQMFVPGVADKWKAEHFEEVQSLGGGVKPDLVVLTMELKRDVLEKIIDTADKNAVEVIVYGSPATQIVNDCFQKISHYICNEGDAAITLGYDKGEVNWNKWEEVTNGFAKQGVKNVVLTLGPAGAYFRNDQDHGYVSGYRKLSELKDTSGLTAAFAGAYAMKYLKHKDSGSWDIRSAAVHGVKAGSLKALGLGSRLSLPWADQIEEVDENPLFDSLQELQRTSLMSSRKMGDRAFVFFGSRTDNLV